MTNEEIKQQIENKAEVYTNNYDRRAFNTDVYSAYIAGAKTYATRAITAEENAINLKAKVWLQSEEIQRLREALELIYHQEQMQGREGCTWGDDSHYDSMSATVGYNQALSNVKDIAEKVLKHKPDEQKASTNI